MSTRPIPTFWEAHPEHPRSQAKIKSSSPRYISNSKGLQTHRHSMIEDDLFDLHFKVKLTNESGDSIRPKADDEIQPEDEHDGDKISSPYHLGNLPSRNKGSKIRSRRPNTSLGLGESSSSLAGLDARMGKTWDTSSSSVTQGHFVSPSSPAGRFSHSPGALFRKLSHSRNGNVSLDMVRQDSSYPQDLSEGERDPSYKMSESIRVSSSHLSPKTKMTSRSNSFRNRTKTLSDAAAQGLECDESRTSTESLDETQDSITLQPVSKNFISRSRSRRRAVSSSPKGNHVHFLPSSSSSPSNHSPAGSTSNLTSTSMSNSKSWYHFSNLRNHLHYHHHQHQDDESEAESIDSIELMCTGAREFNRIRHKQSNGASMDSDEAKLQIQGDGGDRDGEDEGEDSSNSFDSFNSTSSYDRSSGKSDVEGFSTYDSSPKTPISDQYRNHLEHLPLDEVFLRLCDSYEGEVEKASFSNPEIQIQEPEENFLDFSFISSWRNYSLPTTPQQQTNKGLEGSCIDDSSESSTSGIDSSNLPTPTLRSCHLSDLSPNCQTLPNSVEANDRQSTDEDVGSYHSYETAKMIIRERPSAPSSVVDDESEALFNLDTHQYGEDQEGDVDHEDSKEILEEMEESLRVGPIEEKIHESFPRSEKETGLGLGLVFGKDDRHDGIEIVFSLASSSSTDTTSTSTSELHQNCLDQHENGNGFPFVSGFSSPIDKPRPAPFEFTSPSLSYERRCSPIGPSSSPIIYEDQVLSIPNSEPTTGEASSLSPSPPAFRRYSASNASEPYSSTSSFGHSHPMARQSSANSSLSPSSVYSSNSGRFSFFGTSGSEASGSTSFRNSMGSISSPKGFTTSLGSPFASAEDSVGKVEEFQSGAEAKEINRPSSLYIKPSPGHRVVSMKRSSSLGSSQTPSTALSSFHFKSSLQPFTTSDPKVEAHSSSAPTSPASTSREPGSSSMGPSQASRTPAQMIAITAREDILRSIVPRRRPVTATGPVSNSSLLSLTPTSPRPANPKMERRFTSSSLWSLTSSKNSEEPVSDSAPEEVVKATGRSRRFKSKLGFKKDINLEIDSIDQGKFDSDQIEGKELAISLDNEKKSRFNRLARIKSRFSQHRKI